MRRALANLILSLGLLLGWGATLVHLSQLSILKPGRLAQASTQLLDNASVRSALADSLQNSLTPLIGNTLSIPADTFQTIIDDAVANPSVQTQFSNAMNEVQLHVLGQSSGPIVLGGTAFSQVVAAGISRYSSQAAAAIAQQGLSISIPGSALPNLGWFARNANHIESLLISAALVAILLALIIHPNRGAVIRRVGFWLIGMSLVNALLFWFIPTYLLPQIAVSWAQILAVILKAVSGPATTFFVEMLGVGALIVGAGEFVKRIS